MSKRKLIRELKVAKMGGWHVRAAATLLTVNGIECALQYVQSVQKRLSSKQLELPMRSENE